MKFLYSKHSYGLLAWNSKLHNSIGILDQELVADMGELRKKSNEYHLIPE
jgi:hypothetical protein